MLAVLVVVAVGLLLFIPVALRVAGSARRLRRARTALLAALAPRVAAVARLSRGR